MNDPLMSIDAETVEKNVQDSFKTMHKCVKIFAEIPGIPFTKLSKLITNNNDNGHLPQRL